MKIKWKTIQVYESQVWCIFRTGWKISNEKLEWDRNAHMLLTILAKLEKKKKLPKNEKEIRLAMAESHRNQKVAFESRGGIREARVVDLGYLIDSLI